MKKSYLDILYSLRAKRLEKIEALVISRNNEHTHCSACGEDSLSTLDKELTLAKARLTDIDWLIECYIDIHK